MLAKFFFCVFMDRDELAKRERGQYPAILTEQTWSIKDLLNGFRGSFSCEIQGRLQGSQSHRAIWVILPALGASHIIKIDYYCLTCVYNRCIACFDWLIPVHYINNSLHLARQYARIFVRGHYLFREANIFRERSSTDKQL